MDTVPLESIAHFVRGITFKPTDVVSPGTPGTVRCMRTKNVQSTLDLSDIWAVNFDLVKRPEQLLQYGDILISSANSWNLVGKCCFIPELDWRASFGGFVTTLRADEDQVDSRYLFHWFSSPEIQATVRSFGRQTTNITNLDLKRCLKLRIPLPALSEQRRIVDVLDRVDALRAKRKESISLLDSLTDSVFIEMFGDPGRNPRSWPCLPLTEACHCYSGGTPPKSDPANWNGSVPWYSAKDMKRKDLFSSRDTISEAVTERTSLRVLPADTVAIVVRGMILAHTFPVCVLRTPATINQDLKALLPKVNLAPQFLATCLRVQSGYALSQVSSAAHGTAKLNAEGLANIPVLIPPQSLQDEFSSRVSAVETVLNQHRAHLAELDALFASVQHRAFRGELWDGAAA